MSHVTWPRSAGLQSAKESLSAHSPPLSPRGGPRREPGGEQRPREVFSGLGFPRTILSRPRPCVLSALPARPHHARLPSPLCHPGSQTQSLPSIAGSVGPVGREPRARPAHLMAADAAAKGKSSPAAGSSHYLRRGEPKPHSMIVCISATLFRLPPSHTHLFPFDKIITINAQDRESVLNFKTQNMYPFRSAKWFRPTPQHTCAVRAFDHVLFG